VDILDEIKADAKDEQLMRVLTRYGQPLMIAFIVAISLFAAYIWWEGRVRSAQEAWGNQFFRATQMSEQGDKAEAIEQYRLIAEKAAAPYQSLARIFLANIALDANDPVEAVKQFDAIAAAEGTHILGYFAATRSAEIMKSVRVESGQTLQARLAALDNDANPWQNQVRLLEALSAYEKGDKYAASHAIMELQKSPALADGTFATLLSVFAKKIGDPAAEKKPANPILQP
jgi:hypothetical protein